MKKHLLLIFALLTFYNSFSTHLVSAELRLEKKPSVSNKTYNIILTVFYLESSINLNPGLDINTEIITVRDAGRNEIESFLISKDISQNERIDNGFIEPVLKRVFVGEYTFSASNGSKILSYTGDQRRGDITNIEDPLSGNYEIYVETFVFIDGSVPSNSTPEFTTPPQGIAAKDRVYTYDIAAVDPEGDSLSYELVELRYEDGLVIPDQWFPDDPRFGNSQITIDPLTGILTWDSPRIEGVFNVAIQVNEWRNGARKSFSVRDFPIDVVEVDNEEPIITQVRDTCITSGQELVLPVEIVDPDGDRLNFNISGSPTLLSPAMIASDIFGVGTSNINFNMRWIPGCDAIQKNPHAAITRAWDDNPIVSLTTFEASLITVYPEFPKNIQATFNYTGTKSVELNWDAYRCNGANNKIIIYRAECDSTLDRSVCDFKLPDEFSYTKIAELDADEVTFVDDNNGQGLRGAVTYHYVISGKLTFPSIIEGPPSEVISISSTLEAPIITNVSIDSTSATNGKIAVKWISPPGFDQVTNPGPYAYELYRSIGLDGNGFSDSPIYTVTSNTLDNGEFLDTLLNTQELSFSYKVKLLYSGGDIESDFATTTRLETTPGPRLIDLDWEENSVWFRPDSLYQVVWQDTLPDKIIDSVNTLNDFYRIDDLIDGDTFCFYVETRNVFCIQEVADVYTNFSNISCNVPKDTTPPCPPVLDVTKTNCKSFDVTAEIRNELSISYDFSSAQCIDKLSHYNIYFKKRPGLSDYTFLDSIPILEPNPTPYVHDGIDSYTFCYAVSAVDIAGNESELSNVGCNDNCELFDLPNVFTPNGDGKNDFFTPLPESRFVQEIKFRVYNRWGTQIYLSNDDVWINWDGKNNDGDEVSDGVYYFSAEVVFDKLDQESSKIEYKGWVQLTR